MKSFLRGAWLPFALLLAPICATATDAPIAEVLVTTAGVDVTPVPPSTRSGVMLQNLGPEPIWCAHGTGAAAVVIGKVLKIPPGGTVTIGLPAAQHVWCKTPTTNQVTTAATIVTQTLYASTGGRPWPIDHECGATAVTAFTGTAGTVSSLSAAGCYWYYVDIDAFVRTGATATTTTAFPQTAKTWRRVCMNGSTSISAISTGASGNLYTCLESNP